MSMTVNLPDDVARRLAAEAERRGQDVDQVAAEVLAAGLPDDAPQRRPKRRLEFVAMGESTSGRTAAEADEMLAEGFGRD
jgi:predicted transcriptional regulator